MKVDQFRIKMPGRALVHFGAVLAALWLGLPDTAVAQTATTASSVTPESFAPPLRRLDGAVVFSGDTGSQAPAGSEQIGVTLSGVTLEGGLPQMAAANATLKERLTRGRVPVSELFEAVNALERAYANAGFVLARVVLPQQSLRDGGVLRVTVVDGFVETVDGTKVPQQVQRRIELLTGSLVNRRGLTLRELERQLLLAGDTAGVALGSALGAGRLPGGTVLTLDPEYQRITGFVGFDNLAADDLGNFVLNAGIEFNSPLGYGESIYLRASGAPSGYFDSDPRYRVLSGGFVVPLGTSGLALNGEFTISDTTPDSSTAPTRSNFDRQSLRLIYPIIRSRKVNLSTQLSLDHQQDRQNLLGGAVIYDDDISVLRFGGSLSYQHEDGAFSDVGAVVSHGFDVKGAPFSRQGVQPQFTKVTLSGYHQRALAESLILSVTGRAQLAFGDALVTSERFGLTGARELSGFESGNLRGDSGWVMRAEVAHQSRTTIAATPVVVAPYVFLAAGGISIAQPTIVERARENAQSYGLGIDFATQTDSRFRASSLRMEIARGVRDNGADDTRFSISGNFRF